MRDIEVITCEDGDWEVLKVDGNIYHEGHSIDNCIWLELIESYFDARVVETEISEEDMEYGRY